MTQGHLTYYFPTRADLVGAVATRIVRTQLEIFDSQTPPGSVEDAVANISALVTARETTRALAALLLAADVEPGAREAFVELAAGMRQRATTLVAALSGDAADPDRIAAHRVGGRLLHAASVGAAVLSLAEESATDDEATAEMVRHLLAALTRPGSS
jgi:AcrR family transcriptional regulator